MATEVGSAYVRLLPSMQGFSAAAGREMTGGLAGPAALAGRQAGSGYSGGFATSIAAGAGATRASGDKLTAGLTLPLAALGAASVSASRDLNKGMANVATLIPGNTERVAELKGEVQSLAIEFGKSTSDMVDGTYQVISAFGDTSDTVSILETNTMAAAAGAATAGEAIALTSAVTKGYGDTSEEAVGKAADLALMTTRLGQTTFPELAASVGKVIPIASSLGVSQEELFATMATFTGVTGGASEVSTQLRGAMQSVLAPTKDATSAFTAAGFASGAAAVEELGLAGAMGLLTSAADESGKPLQKYISSVEGQVLALGLAEAQAADYETKLSAMNGAQGTTAAAFAEATQGIDAQGFEWDQTKQRLVVFSQRLGDALVPALGAALTAAEPLLSVVEMAASAFESAGSGTQTATVGIAGLGLVAGPVMSVVGRMAGVVTSAGRGIVSLGRGVVTAGRSLMVGGRAVGQAALSFGRLGLAAGRAALVVGRAVLTMGARLAVSAARGAAALAVQAARWVVMGVTALASAAKVALAWLISMGPIILVGAAVVGLALLIYKNFDKIKAWVGAAFRWIGQKGQEAVAFVKRIWAPLFRIYTAPYRLAWAAIKLVYAGLKRGVAIVKAYTVGRLKELGRAFLTFGVGVKRVFTSAMAWARSQITRAKTFISGALRSLESRFRSAKSSIIRTFRSLASGVAAPFRSAFKSIIGYWNRYVGGKGFSIPSWVPGVGGKSFRIPKFHDGGVFKAERGSGGEGLALLRDNEAIFTPEQMKALGSGGSPVAVGGGGATIRISGDGLDRALLEWLRRSIRVEGGNVQTVLGA